MSTTATSKTNDVRERAPAAALSTVARLAFIAACLFVLVAPMVAMKVKAIDETPLTGVFITAKRPNVSLGSVRDERFQKEMIEWFEQNYGLKPTLVRLDNTIGYRVFNETRFETHVRIGEDGILYNPELISFDNQPPTPFVRIEKTAKLIHDVQTGLRARGKVLVFIILPSKMLVFPDKVPGRWRDQLQPPGPRYWQTTNYEPFVKELRRLGVVFVDGPTEFASLIRDNPKFVYAPEARHLNAPAECLMFERGLEQARPLLPTKVIPHLDCATELKKDPWIGEEEFDLFRLMNTWGSPQTKELALLKPNIEESVPLAKRPSTLIVGSSFAGRYLLETTRNHATARTHFFYYNRTLIDPELKESPIPDASTQAWRDLALTRDLYVVPMPQEHLPDGSNEFFEQLLAGLQLTVNQEL